MAECTEHCNMLSVKVTISEKNMIYEHRRQPQPITNAEILPLQTFPVSDHTTLPQWDWRPHFHQGQACIVLLVSVAIQRT